MYSIAYHIFPLQSSRFVVHFRNSIRNTSPSHGSALEMPLAIQLAINDKWAANEYRLRDCFPTLSGNTAIVVTAIWAVIRQEGKKIMPHVLWPELLSAAQLKRLEEHKYSASGRSLLEPPLQIYWNWLVQQIPLWVAPNTLTIVGLLINVLTTAVLVFYCPTATEEVSSGVPGQSFYVAQNNVGEIGKAQDWCPLCNIERQQSTNVTCLLNLYWLLIRLTF